MSDRKKLWDLFYRSHGYWYSWCMVPLSYRDMLLAVAFGDAEVKEIDDDPDWPADLYFRWVKPVGDRSHHYVDKDFSDGIWPKRNTKC